MPENLMQKFLGGMVGSALGDAIGELAFSYFRETELRAKIRQSAALIYTDDTAMAIGLAESITRVGRLDGRHLGDTFRMNYSREPWRGYASGPPTIFSIVKKYNIPYSEAAGRLFGGQASYGNGAAMRIGPVGLFFYDAPDLYKQSRIASQVTHAHPVGVDGAAVLAKAIADAVRLDPEEGFPLEQFLKSLIDFARTDEIRNKMKLVKNLLAENVPPPEAASLLGRSVAVQESMPFAIYAFLSNYQSFEECLFCAILNGGDRDTLGAMACSVSGAYLGIEAIPESWQEKVENCRQIAALALILLEVKLKS